jgi:hypothetical protein
VGCWVQDPALQVTVLALMLRMPHCPGHPIASCVVAAQELPLLCCCCPCLPEQGPGQTPIVWWSHASQHSWSCHLAPCLTSSPYNHHQLLFLCFCQVALVLTSSFCGRIQARTSLMDTGQHSHLETWATPGTDLGSASEPTASTATLRWGTTAVAAGNFRLLGPRKCHIELAAIGFQQEYKGQFLGPPMLRMAISPKRKSFASGKSTAETALQSSSPHSFRMALQALRMLRGSATPARSLVDNNRNSLLPVIQPTSWQGIPAAPWLAVYELKAHGSSIATARAKGCTCSATSGHAVPDSGAQRLPLTLTGQVGL